MVQVTIMGKRLSVPLVAIVGVVILAGGIAIAMVLLRSPVTGSVSTADQAGHWTTAGAGGTPEVSCTGAIGGVQLSNGAGSSLFRDAEITMENAWPGAECEWQIYYAIARGESERVLQLDMTGLPEGWSATLDTPCGTELPASATRTAINFRVVMGEEAELNGGTDHPITGSLVTVPESLWEGCG